LKRLRALLGRASSVKDGGSKGKGYGDTLTNTHSFIPLFSVSIALNTDGTSFQANRVSKRERAALHGCVLHPENPLLPVLSRTYTKGHSVKKNRDFCGTSPLFGVAAASVLGIVR